MADDEVDWKQRYEALQEEYKELTEASQEIEAALEEQVKALETDNEEVSVWFCGRAWSD